MNQVVVTSERIDRMSSLPDELLLNILSSLSINQVVVTSVLSKRWRFLWKSVTKLNYDFLSCQYKHLLAFVESKQFCNASDRVLLSFNLKLYPHADLAEYVRLLAHLLVREVRLELFYASVTLPRSLYNEFLTLDTLILERLVLEDVPDTQLGFQLRFLKTLHLLSVRFSDDESVQRLLGSCPVLEDLVVRRTSYVHVMMFIINVPTLRSLSIEYSCMVSQPMGVHGFMINAPSLRYLNIRDYFSSVLQIAHMPELLKANVDVESDKFLGSLSSVRSLSLCCKISKMQYPTGTFVCLEHVELCTCSPVWWNVLTSILDDAPKLQVLKLKLKHCVRHSTDPMDRWNQPSSVPKCLWSHLEIFEWRRYKGTKQEKRLSKYILANAIRLKMATFSSVSPKKKRIFNKLKYVAKGSEVCQLVFV